jgi:hypothetical protein
MGATVEEWEEKDCFATSVLGAGGWFREDWMLGVAAEARGHTGKSMVAAISSISISQPSFASGPLTRMCDASQETMPRNSLIDLPFSAVKSKRFAPARIPITPFPKRGRATRPELICAAERLSGIGNAPGVTHALAPLRATRKTAAT